LIDHVDLIDLKLAFCKFVRVFCVEIFHLHFFDVLLNLISTIDQEFGISGFIFEIFDGLLKFVLLELNFGSSAEFDTPLNHWEEWVQVIVLLAVSRLWWVWNIPCEFFKDSLK